MPEIEIIMDSIESNESNEGFISNSFYLSADLADIWIVCGQIESKFTKLPAHKVLLAQKSQIFRQIFVESPGLSEIRLRGIGAEGIKSFLRFVYDNSFIWDNQITTANEVMRLAKQFQVFTLPLLVSEEITAMVHNSNTFLSITSFGELIEFMAEFKLEKKTQLKVMTFGSQHISQILEYHFMSSQPIEKVLKVIEVLKPTQTQIMAALSEDIIKLSNKAPQEFEIFIELAKCTGKELIELYQRNMFVNQNLLELAKNKFEAIEGYFAKV